MSVFEIGMLICFGASWPISIAKTLKTKAVTGKSALFLLIVILGYICGIVHKILYSRDFVIYLYALNLILVTIDLVLCLYYSKKQHVTTI
jgi:hypothetical protein